MTLDQTRPGVMALVVIFTILTTVIVVLRFTIRKMQENPYGPDDWFIIPAWLCFAGIAGVMITGVVRGLIASELDSTEITNDFIVIYLILNAFSTVTLGLIRLSALFYYRRIFITKAKPRSAFGTITIFVIVLVIVRTLAFLTYQIAQCRSENLKDTCFAYTYVEAMAASSFFLDALVVFLPMPVIWTLHTTSGRKLGITLVFLLAAAGIAASCTRMVSYYELHQKQTSSLIYTQILYYLVLEVGFGLVAVNLPSLWYLFKDLTPERVLQYVRSPVGFPYDQSSDAGLPINSKESEKSDSGIVVTQDYIVEFKSHELAT